MARSGENGQNASSLRRRLRSAVKHKKLADTMLDSIKNSQTALNSALDKLNADTAIALDTDYEATQALSSVVEFDGEGTGAQHKQSLRKTLRSALAHRRLADEIADAMEEWQVAFNAWMAKLDAEAGTLASTDFASSVGVEVTDADAEGEDAQHKATWRKSMTSAMANKPLADTIMDSISGMQEAMNASLALLDAGTVAGAHAALKVTEIDPD